MSATLTWLEANHTYAQRNSVLPSSTFSHSYVSDILRSARESTLSLHPCWSRWRGRLISTLDNNFVISEVSFFFFFWHPLHFFFFLYSDYWIGWICERALKLKGRGKKKKKRLIQGIAEFITPVCCQNNHQCYRLTYKTLQKANKRLRALHTLLLNIVLMMLMIKRISQSLYQDSRSFKFKTLED